MNQDLWTKLQEDARESFRKMKSEHSRQEEITFRTESGSVTTRILEFIEKEKIDLVVMGTNGATGLNEYLIGSNTEKIVRFSKVPVFVVRKAVNLSSIRHIVLPTTLELNQVDFINKIKELQKLLDASLWLLVVNRPGDDLKTEARRADLRDFVAHYNITNYVLKVHDDENVESGIVNFTDRVGADMIAMGTHGRKGLAHLFAGSFTEDIVNHVTCPIWTYKIK
jgi:nucleotide-binding universal stress UspA family protein